MPAFTVKHYLDVPVGSLNNNKADIDRINIALTKCAGSTDCKMVDWPFNLINTASRIVRENQGEVTVTVKAAKDRLKVVAIEPGDTRACNYGLAIDIGTTTLAVELVDLINGRTVKSEGALNGQIQYGEDLLTRLHLAGQGGLDGLHSSLIDTINGLIASVCASSGVQSSQISAVCAAGNTSMTHFFLGIDPSPMRFEPYIPVINHAPYLIARDLGIDANPYAIVYTFPSVGAYFGGDIISGVIASGMAEREEISLLLDIGTNVEAVLGNKDWLLAIAGSAGPALEGGVAECARRAEPGAIERVSIDPKTFEPSYKSIDDMPPIGLCGSGLIDTVAELYRTGLLDPTGKFVLDKKTDRFKTINGRTAYVIAEGDDGRRPTYITEKDINNLLTTKAAMVAALTILLNSVGLHMEDIQRIYTAGSFGIHVSVDSATTMGLYPRLPADRFVPLGNGSLKGSVEVLLHGEKVKDAERLADKITYLELNVHPEFMDIFRSAKYIS